MNGTIKNIKNDSIIISNNITNKSSLKEDKILEIFKKDNIDNTQKIVLNGSKSKIRKEISLNKLSCLQFGNVNMSNTFSNNINSKSGIKRKINQESFNNPHDKLEL